MLALEPKLRRELSVHCGLAPVLVDWRLFDQDAALLDLPHHRPADELLLRHRDDLERVERLIGRTFNGERPRGGEGGPAATPCWAATPSA